MLYWKTWYSKKGGCSRFFSDFLRQPYAHSKLSNDQAFKFWNFQSVALKSSLLVCMSSNVEPLKFESLPVWWFESLRSWSLKFRKVWKLEDLKFGSLKINSLIGRLSRCLTFTPSSCQNSQFQNYKSSNYQTFNLSNFLILSSFKTSNFQTFKFQMFNVWKQIQTSKPSSTHRIHTSSF